MNRQVERLVLIVSLSQESGKRAFEFLILALGAMLLLLVGCGGDATSPANTPQSTDEVLAFASRPKVAHKPWKPPKSRFAQNLVKSYKLGERDFSNKEFLLEDLVGADLRGANFSGADLRASNLCGADLTGAVLDGAKFEHAIYCAQTRWPEGFDHKAQKGLAFVGPNMDLRELKIAFFGTHFLIDRIDLSGVNFTGKDFSWAKFYGCNLQGANFEGADLSSVDLKKVLLVGANLKDANLSGSSFAGSDLSGADLRANLCGTDLEEANLTDAFLRGAIYNHRTKFPKDLDPGKEGMVGLVENGDISGRSFLNRRFHSLKLKGADLSGSDFSGTAMHGGDFRRANLRNAVFARADLRSANLLGANLSGANLTDAKLRSAVYDDDTIFPAGFEPADHKMWKMGPKANLRGARLYDQDLSGVDLRGADLTNADLAGTILAGAKLDGAVLTGARQDQNTRFPAGFDQGKQHLKFERTPDL